VTRLDAADLVVIASHVLGISTGAALAQLDIAAAEAALAEARSSGLDRPDADADADAAAAAGVGLMRALLRHRPFPGHGQQLAVAAGLQFLSLNGWRADLNPAATTVVVVEALASGQLTSDDAAAWLSPRLSPVPAAKRAPVTALRPRRERPPSIPGRRAPSGRTPGGRTVAGVVLAVAVGGSALLAAACSRAPEVPAPPTSVVHVVGPGAASGAAGH
jgi:prophage maintenance system killer protein